MAVTLPAALLAPYERFTLYNSPYPAHDRGCAVDLYPAAAIAAHPGGRTPAPSPVAGEVLDTRSVAAPSRPYAADRDHLVLVDVERPAPVAGLVARLLHVEPSVAPGDRVDVGDAVGTLVRSGYFAPWVPDHVHLGFREPGADPYRAAGSLRLEPGVDVEPLAWDGTGEVVASDDSYAVLDSPAHPAPGDRWVGVGAAVGAGATVGSGASAGADAGADADPATAVLDGGLPHYAGGGLLGADAPDGPVSLAGHRVGVAAGRDAAWDDVAVRANGRPVTGLSLFCARDAGFGAKLVGEGLDLAVGERVAVSIVPAGEGTGSRAPVTDG